MKKILRIFFCAVLVFSTFTLSSTTDITILANTSGVNHNEGVPSVFESSGYPSSIEVPIEIWDQQQDDIVFQKDKVHGAANSGLVQNQLVDGKPVPTTSGYLNDDVAHFNDWYETTNNNAYYQGKLKLTLADANTGKYVYEPIKQNTYLNKNYGLFFPLNDMATSTAGNVNNVLSDTDLQRAREWQDEAEVRYASKSGKSGVVCEFDDYKIDKSCYIQDFDKHNYHFTTKTQIKFTYVGGEEFNFKGDDDVWVFVGDQADNGTLVVDLGGSHGAQDGNVTFGKANVSNWNGNIPKTGSTYSSHPGTGRSEIKRDLGMEIGKTYYLTIFQAERNTNGSSFKIETTLTFDQLAVNNVKTAFEEGQRTAVFENDVINKGGDATNISHMASWFNSSTTFKNEGEFLNIEEGTDLKTQSFNSIPNKGNLRDLEYAYVDANGDIVDDTWTSIGLSEASNDKNGFKLSKNVPIAGNGAINNGATDTVRFRYKYDISQSDLAADGLYNKFSVKAANSLSGTSVESTQALGSSLAFKAQVGTETTVAAKKDVMSDVEYETEKVYTENGQLLIYKYEVVNTGLKDAKQMYLDFSELTPDNDVQNIAEYLESEAEFEIDEATGMVKLDLAIGEVATFYYERKSPVIGSDTGNVYSSQVSAYQNASRDSLDGDRTSSSAKATVVIPKVTIEQDYQVYQSDMLPSEHVFSEEAKQVTHGDQVLYKFTLANKSEEAKNVTFRAFTNESGENIQIDYGRFIDGDGNEVILHDGQVSLGVGQSATYYYIGEKLEPTEIHSTYTTYGEMINSLHELVLCTPHEMVVEIDIPKLTIDSTYRSVDDITSVQNLETLFTELVSEPEEVLVNQDVVYKVTIENSGNKEGQMDIVAKLNNKQVTLMDVNKEEVSNEGITVAAKETRTFYFVQHDVNGNPAGLEHTFVANIQNAHEDFIIEDKTTNQYAVISSPETSIQQKLAFGPFSSYEEVNENFSSLSFVSAAKDDELRIPHKQSVVFATKIQNTGTYVDKVKLSSIFKQYDTSADVTSYLYVRDNGIFVSLKDMSDLVTYEDGAYYLHIQPGQTTTLYYLANNVEGSKNDITYTLKTSLESEYVETDVTSTFKVGTGYIQLQHVYELLNESDNASRDITYGDSVRHTITLQNNGTEAAEVKLHVVLVSEEMQLQNSLVESVTKRLLKTGKLASEDNRSVYYDDTVVVPANTSITHTFDHEMIGGSTQGTNYSVHASIANEEYPEVVDADYQNTSQSYSVSIPEVTMEQLVAVYDQEYSYKEQTYVDEANLEVHHQDTLIYQTKLTNESVHEAIIDMTSMMNEETVELYDANMQPMDQSFSLKPNETIYVYAIYDVEGLPKSGKLYEKVDTVHYTDGYAYQNKVSDTVEVVVIANPKIQITSDYAIYDDADDVREQAFIREQSKLGLQYSDQLVVRVHIENIGEYEGEVHLKDALRSASELGTLYDVNGNELHFDEATDYSYLLESELFNEDGASSFTFYIVSPPLTDEQFVYECEIDVEGMDVVEEEEIIDREQGDVIVAIDPNIAYQVQFIWSDEDAPFESIDGKVDGQNPTIQVEELAVNDIMDQQDVEDWKIKQIYQLVQDEKVEVKEDEIEITRKSNTIQVVVEPVVQPPVLPSEPEIKNPEVDDSSNGHASIDNETKNNAKDTTTNHVLASNVDTGDRTNTSVLFLVCLLSVLVIGYQIAKRKQ
ncbi:fibro-slime domain-containing protein [Breznakia blatticola]|uniref:Fibro-slime domain-containing protein n=1 Tax=Breznakia blatticola TaxID=1754012 RepID=A0A4R7ZHU4_9FIRM|nr:fibro-slime domain-containing protein [Breznakia blatticola]TDW16942.1 fibro-slime domain-containing protein [Breznakia blatticola]